MRPVLVLVATELFGGDIRKAIDAAIGIELFHNFTLMHDDIMDKAPLRRGKPTVHAKWNESAAIDDTILRDVLDIFSDTASGVCQGQQEDMNFEQRSDVSITEYLEMIRKKTAVLLAGSMQIGALIGGAEKSQAELLYSFGENLGIAFQLQDDILDVYGDPEKFGKQVGGDIISNKKTFMLIKALELAKGEIAEELNYWLNLENFDSEAKVSTVSLIYNKLKVKELAEREMMHYAGKALEALDKINASGSNKELLRTFAEQLLIREQ